MDLKDYKKAWKNQPEEKNKMSALEIYQMTQATSISIVKWIFIIGILEFIIMNSFYLFFEDPTQKEMIMKFGMTNIFYMSQIIAIFVILYFLIMFYKNYREISVIDNTKVLMKRILKTRKTVRNYVIFNLSYLVFASIMVSIGSLRSDYADFSMKKSIIFIILMTVATTILVFIFWLFYQLLYGVLLKKLTKNYKSLEELKLK